MAVSMLDMEQQLGVLAQERQATSEQVPSRLHVGGIDIGLRQHAAAEQDSDLTGGLDMEAHCFSSDVCRPHRRGHAPHFP
jgi:hypothetical protein